MTDYREADMSRLKTVPIAQRPNKVDRSLLAHPPGGDRSFGAFWDSLPDVLAARDLRDVARQVARAAGRRGVVVMLGGHVIKVGLGPLLRELVERGAITHLAMNGSAAIHDFELAAYGGTSEDVAAGLSVPEMVVPEQREQARANLGRRVEAPGPGQHGFMIDDVVHVPLRDQPRATRHFEP